MQLEICSRRRLRLPEHALIGVWIKAVDDPWAIYLWAVLIAVLLLVVWILRGLAWLRYRMSTYLWAIHGQKRFEVAEVKF
jgi:hypothetical protein